MSAGEALLTIAGLVLITIGTRGFGPFARMNRTVSRCEGE